MKWLFKLILILLAIVILYISLTMAGLELISQEDKSNSLRKLPISFEWKNDKGEIQINCYKLPETSTLPNNPFYFLKNIRDELWIRFSKSPLDKARITLLIADKKMEEAINLEKRNKDKNLIDKTVKDAVEKLKSAGKITETLNQKDIEVDKINTRISEAKLAYKYIIESLELDNEKNNFLIKNIESCYE
jgi:hypothetical protein